MAQDLDEYMEAFGHRTLSDAGPFGVLAADVLTMKVSQGGRVINTVYRRHRGQRGRTPVG